MNKFKRFMKEEDGYGTVEMILIIGGVGLLATGIFNVLTDSLSKGDESAVSQVATSIGEIVKGWNDKLGDGN